MSDAERERGLELRDSVWNAVQGYTPDEICFALISVLATLIAGASANPAKMAERMARNLVRTVARPAEKSELN
jgi:hypothetical protein